MRREHVEMGKVYIITRKGKDIPLKTEHDGDLIRSIVCTNLVTNRTITLNTTIPIKREATRQDLLNLGILEQVDTHQEDDSDKPSRVGVAAKAGSSFTIRCRNCGECFLNSYSDYWNHKVKCHKNKKTWFHSR